MATAETKDKSQWALPPTPDDVRAFRRSMEELSERQETWLSREQNRNKEKGEAFRSSLKKTSERWNDHWNRETV